MPLRRNLTKILCLHCLLSIVYSLLSIHNLLYAFSIKTLRLRAHRSGSILDLLFTLRPLLVGGLVKRRGLTIFPEEINEAGANKWKMGGFCCPVPK